MMKDEKTTDRLLHEALIALATMSVITVGSDGNQMTIPLTSYQARQVKQAAELLPSYARVAFERSVANRLADLDHVSDADVNRACEFALSCRGVSAPATKVWRA
jgi:hypothetical protein